MWDFVLLHWWEQREDDSGRGGTGGSCLDAGLQRGWGAPALPVEEAGGGGPLSTVGSSMARLVPAIAWAGQPQKTPPGRGGGHGQTTWHGLEPQLRVRGSIGILSSSLQPTQGPNLLCYHPHELELPRSGLIRTGASWGLPLGR